MYLSLGGFTIVTFAFTTSRDTFSSSQSVCYPQDFHQSSQRQRHPAFAIADALQLQSEPVERFAGHQRVSKRRASDEATALVRNRFVARCSRRGYGSSTAKVRHDS